MTTDIVPVEQVIKAACDIALSHSNYGHEEGNKRAFAILRDLERKLPPTNDTAPAASGELVDELLDRFGLVLTDDPEMGHDEQSFGQARDAFVAALSIARTTAERGSVADDPRNPWRGPLKPTPTTSGEVSQRARYMADRFEWAAPGDNQEDAWIVRFLDKDCREAVFTGSDAETEAWEHYERYAPAYNLYVFRLARLREAIPATPPVVDREAVAKTFLAEWYDWPDNPEEWWNSLSDDERSRGLRTADAIISLIGESVPDGYVAVPREPTEAMIEAARVDIQCRRDCRVSKATGKQVWFAMLAAAPSPSDKGER